MFNVRWTAAIASLVVYRKMPDTTCKKVMRIASEQKKTLSRQESVKAVHTTTTNSLVSSEYWYEWGLSKRWVLTQHGIESLQTDFSLYVHGLRFLLAYYLLTPTTVAGLGRSAASVCVSVWLSVCLPVCSHDETKTAETTI